MGDTPQSGPSRPRLSGRQLLLVGGLGVLVLALSAGAAALLRGRLERQATPGTVQAEEVNLLGKGKFLYQRSCASCHGTEGHGDGPSAADLKSPPRDFARGPWKFARTPGAVRRVIAEGIPGTAMPASGQTLAPDELDALTAYILTLAPDQDRSAAVPAGVRTLLERAGLSPAAGPQDAPDLELRDLSGRLSALGGRKGQVVLIVFWETTCLPCLKKLPGLERLAAAFRDRGVAVVPVCLDEEDTEALRRVAGRHVETLPLYTDARGVARLRYDVQALPTACLIDQAGRLLGRGPGPSDWAGPEVQELLRACLAPPR